MVSTEPIVSEPIETDVELPAAFAATEPDTEYLPPITRMTRGELDALPTRQNEMKGISALAGPANVIMQLAMPAVGYGVYESRVDSGNLFKHPIKRTRTTLSYLAVASMGSPRDRRLYRKAVGSAHAKVRSTADSPVKYNAFDPKLQLWVAACLYKGWEDMQLIYGDPADITEEAYQNGAVLGTTLQVPREMWPATRADFEAYWNETVETFEIDPVIRDHLMSIVRAEFLPRWFSIIFGWWFELLTIGFLPQNFREKMGLEFKPWQRRVFDAHNKLAKAITDRLPKPLREFPFNVLLWDVRWRIRTGRPLV
jgi:uncharacterized protein (DUF2236 family)